VSAIAAGGAWFSVPPRYEPIERGRPQWFDDAKFGIFIHWSLFSVPAYAPAGKGSIHDIAAEEGVQALLKNSPYAEWYQNSLRIEGSPTQTHHRETYGEDFTYEDFAPAFNRQIESWDPEQWAELFEAAGAQYVVMVTKHHDGFLLWPSEHPNPHRAHYQASRDTVGELTAAVRARGMRMGLYYSGGLDWTFSPFPIADPATYLTNAPQSQAYADYVMAHWDELIDRYKPDVLWNDICFPRKADLRELFATYYERVPEGVVNNRWIQYPPIAAMAGAPGLRSVVNALGERFSEQPETIPPLPFHCDFVTPEYTVFPEVQALKWETCRGIGQSFGYNQMEDADDYLTADAAIRMLVDVVSKNCNLLLNVGPIANGDLSPEQVACLQGIGDWLAVNGAAIYGTRPWERAEGRTADGIEVRFTTNGDDLFVILLEPPRQGAVEVIGLAAGRETRVWLLGREEQLDWSRRGDNLRIELPKQLPSAPVIALRLSSKGLNGAAGGRHETGEG
jgi:alpha-L-fucosidase